MQNSPDSSVIPKECWLVGQGLRLPLLAFGIVAYSRPFRYDEAFDLSLLNLMLI